MPQQGQSTSTATEKLKTGLKYGVPAALGLAAGIGAGTLIDRALAGSPIGQKILGTPPGQRMRWLVPIGGALGTLTGIAAATRSQQRQKLEAEDLSRKQMDKTGSATFLLVKEANEEKLREALMAHPAVATQFGAGSPGARAKKILGAAAAGGAVGALKGFTGYGQMMGGPIAGAVEGSLVGGGLAAGKGAVGRVLAEKRYKKLLEESEGKKLKREEIKETMSPWLSRGTSMERVGKSGIVGAAPGAIAGLKGVQSILRQFAKEGVKFSPATSQKMFYGGAALGAMAIPAAIYALTALRKHRVSKAVEEAA